MRAYVSRGLFPFGWGLLVWLCSVTVGFGKHIYGGDLTLQATNRPDYYKMTLTLFFDETSSQLEQYEEQIIVSFFQKNGNQIRIDTLYRAGSFKLLYDNPACAKLRALSVLQVKYEGEVYLDPKRFNNTNGYYVAWERCCRSDVINNISNPGKTGMAFYMEFPAIRQNGAVFRNSSPDFGAPNGAYACVNKPITLNFGATDADGDQLVYSLVTPMAGHLTSGGSAVGMAAPYADAKWLAGYSASNAIKGNPGLSIDSRTGQLSVTPSEVGLFIFSVLCEEFRNGVRIGAVRRDFQIPVVNCSGNTPSVPVITHDGQVAKDIVVCSGTPVSLTTEADPAYTYQWQRDNTNIPGATSPTLTVKESGAYTVVKSFATVCANDTFSIPIKVQLADAGLKISASKNALCPGQSVALSVTSQPDITYQWYLNGSVIPNATQPTLTAMQAGQYAVQTTLAKMGCSGRDSLTLTAATGPKAAITASARTLCPGDSVRLTATDGPSFQYQWYRDNAPLNGSVAAALTVGQTGIYRVRVTDDNLCETLTDSVQVFRSDNTPARFDTLAPQCVSATGAVPLSASPGGGLFSGPGVDGNQFNPSKAGVGRHTLTYTVTASGSCSAVVSRQVEVIPSVEIGMPDKVTISRGDTILLQPTVAATQATYRWEPPASLSDPTSRITEASPAQSTTYRLAVTSPNGCISEKSILVEVKEPVEANRLFIADAFSPNGDGINDVLEIRNIDKYPDSEIFIFNRWGEIIYRSKGYTTPWDGTYLKQKVPAGVYLYVVKTGQSLLPDQKGSVLVMY